MNKNPETYVFLREMCSIFARANKAYEEYLKIPCPKPAFDGWGEVDAFMSQLAANLSETSGVSLQWDSSPTLENPLGELGVFKLTGKPNLSYEELLAEANMRYLELKIDKGEGHRYSAPEQIPQIQSDQIKAVLRVLVAVLNRNERKTNEG